MVRINTEAPYERSCFIPQKEEIGASNDKPLVRSISIGADSTLFCSCKTKTVSFFYLK